jgi:hypothetical protein
MYRPKVAQSKRLIQREKAYGSGNEFCYRMLHSYITFRLRNVTLINIEDQIFF